MVRRKNGLGAVGCVLKLFSSKRAPEFFQLNRPNVENCNELRSGDFPTKKTLNFQSKTRRWAFVWSGSQNKNYTSGKGGIDCDLGFTMRDSFGFNLL